VLQSGVSGQDGVIGLHDGSGYLGSWVHSKLQLGLLAVVDTEPLHEQGGESGASTATKAVEDEEALESSTLVSQLTDTIQNQVDDLLTNGVVTTGVVIGCILLSGDKLLRVEQLAVGACSDLIWNRECKCLMNR
jgi:hypothetical protein